MTALMDDFYAICDFGGRFAGSGSEAAASDWLAARLEQVSGKTPRRVPVEYLAGPGASRYWTGSTARVVRTTASPWYGPRGRRPVAWRRI